RRGIWWNVDTGARSGTPCVLAHLAFRTSELSFQNRSLSVPPPLSVNLCTDATHRRIRRELAAKRTPLRRSYVGVTRRPRWTEAVQGLGEVVPALLATDGSRRLLTVVPGRQRRAASAAASPPRNRAR